MSEALADCFAIEIKGIDPPIWSVAFTGSDLEEWIDVVKNTWTNSTYDHRKWLFGTTSDIPRWVGYSISFKLVKDFLAENPAKKISSLFNEPANSFSQ